MSHIIASSPAPEPVSAAELRAQTLRVIRRPAVTPADYRLRYILNDLLTQWTAEIEVAS